MLSSVMLANKFIGLSFVNITEDDDEEKERVGMDETSVIMAEIVATSIVALEGLLRETDM